MATASMTLTAAALTVLNNNEKSNNGGFTHKITITDTDAATGGAALTGATDALTVIFPIATGTDFFVEKCVCNVVEAFAGSGGLAIEVGTDGDPNNFVTSTSVLTAGPIVTAAGGVPATLAGSKAAASDVLQAVLTNSTSGSISALTAGQVDIYLALRDLNNIG